MRDVPRQDTHQSPSMAQLFGSFLRLGITAFGGPAMIPYVRKMAVVQKHWLDGESFQDGVALCQVIPGATVMQMVAYVGLKMRGVAGALASYIGFGLPALLLMLLLSILYTYTRSLPAVVSAFSGMQAIIVAVVANATLSFGKNLSEKLEERDHCTHRRGAFRAEGESGPDRLAGSFSGDAVGSQAGRIPSGCA